MRLHPWSGAFAMVGVIALSLVAAACGAHDVGAPTGVSPADSAGGAQVRLARSADTLVVDQSLPLTAIIPARYGIASELGAVWSSSDTSVAVVTQGGMVFGLKSGIATVDVTTHGSSSATKLTVRPSIRLVRFDADTLALGLSQAVKLPFRAIDSDGRSVDLSKHRVEWTSSAPDIATLSSDGGVTGKALGATDVRLSVDGKASFIAWIKIPLVF